MIHIAVCDDEKIETEYLTRLVNQWAMSEKIDIQVTSFDSAEAFLFTYEYNKKFDILLLDIMMKQLDGIALAKKLRNEGGQMHIVFITGLPDFITEGYEVSALHYLMKPVRVEKLEIVLNKAMSLIEKQETVLIIDTETGVVRLPVNEIQYIEAFAHNTKIQTTSGSHEVKRSISELESRLDEGFCRVHRSYLVGLRYIRQILKTGIVIDDSTLIPLSRRRYNEVNRAFIRFFKEVE